jgi:hypothetical protein
MGHLQPAGKDSATGRNAAPIPVIRGWRGNRRFLPALLDRDIAGRDLVFMGGEGCQNFVPLALRDLEEVQSSSEFCCNLIEFSRGDPEVPVGFSTPSGERLKWGMKTSSGGQT